MVVILTMMVTYTAGDSDGCCFREFQYDASMDGASENSNTMLTWMMTCSL